MEHILDAKEGNDTILSITLQDVGKKSKEAKIINALIPYAALVKMSHQTNQLFYDYMRTTDFENRSEVYAAVEKLAPILVLEEIRTRIRANEPIDSTKLTKLHKKADEFIKPFATQVMTLYINKLCERNGIHPETPSQRV
jgi:hypothetical protein